MFSLKCMESPYGPPPELKKNSPDFSLIAFSQSSDINCRSVIFSHLFLFRQDGDKNAALEKNCGIRLPFPLRKNAFLMFQCSLDIYITGLTSYIHIRLYLIDFTVSFCAISWRFEHVGFVCNTNVGALHGKGNCSYAYICKYLIVFMCCCALKCVWRKNSQHGALYFASSNLVNGQT